MKASLPAALNSAAILLAIMTLLPAQGCDSSPDLLTNSEQDSVAKLRTGKYTLIANDELSALKHDAEVGKSVGRYQVHREGLRTWRLDSATGQTCLLLTSEEDWKTPGVKDEGCGSQ